MATQPLWGSVTDIGEVADDDLLALWGQGVIYELFEGRVVQEAMTSVQHGWVANQIGFYLTQHLIAIQLPARVVQHTLFNLTQPGQLRTVLAPDVALLPLNAPLSAAVPTFAPWLAVEIISPSQTAVQMRMKAHVYFAAGAAEIWIVDPPRATLEVLTPAGSVTYHDQQAVGSVILPGFHQTVAVLVA